MKKFLTAMLVCMMGVVGFLGGCDGGGAENGGSEGELPTVTSGTFKNDLHVDIKSTVSDTYSYDYGRVAECEDGTLISTAEELNNNYGGIPIYRSVDGGVTWVKNTANINDPNKAANFNAWWQPDLYVAQCDVGDGSVIKKGDVLLVALSINGNIGTMTKTILNLYHSSDKGVTWSFLSEVAGSRIVNGAGGTNTGAWGLWEGHIMINDDGVLIVYYADETAHNIYSQRIVYKKSTDGTNWSEVVNVTAYGSNRGARPGMPSCVRMKNGKYFLTYEIVAWGSGGVPVYYKVSDDGLNWVDASLIGTEIFASVKVPNVITGLNQTVKVNPSSSPYVGWTKAGVDDNGTLIVTSQSTHYSAAHPGNPNDDTALIDLFVSYDLGSTWARINHPLPYYDSTQGRVAYSNSLTVSNDNTKIYFANSLKSVAGSGTNYIMFASVDIAKSLKV